jgi:hypothetical protein
VALAQSLFEGLDVGDAAGAPSGIACLLEDPLNVVRILRTELADPSFQRDRTGLADLELGPLDEIAEVRLEKGEVRGGRWSRCHICDAWQLLHLESLNKLVEQIHARCVVAPGTACTLFGGHLSIGSCAKNRAHQAIQPVNARLWCLQQRAHDLDPIAQFQEGRLAARVADRDEAFLEFLGPDVSGIRRIVAARWRRHGIEQHALPARKVKLASLDLRVAVDRARTLRKHDLQSRKFNDSSVAGGQVEGAAGHPVEGTAEGHDGVGEEGGEDPAGREFAEFPTSTTPWSNFSDKKRSSRAPSAKNPTRRGTDHTDLFSPPGSTITPRAAAAR